MTWLLSWLWQGMAIALVVAALLRMARRLNAATRYAIWWAALVAVLALPALQAIDRQRASQNPASGVLGVMQPDVSAFAPITIPAAPDWLVSIVIGAWLGSVVVRLHGVGRSFLHIQRLNRTAIGVLPDREARLTGWIAARASAGRRAMLAVSDAVDLPCALGLGRAVILLPRTLGPDLAGCTPRQARGALSLSKGRRLRQASATLDEARRAKSGGPRQLSDEDLDRIVLHELGHVRRYDDWARLAQSIVDALAGVHPAVWWIGRRLDLEREAACDDYVIARTGDSTQYAACLTRAAEMARRARRVQPAIEQALAPGATRTGRELARRVHRLLDRRRGRRPWPIAASLGASVVTAVTALAIVARLSAFVMLVDAAPIAAPDVTIAAAKLLVLDSSRAKPAGVSNRERTAPAASQSKGAVRLSKGEPLRQAQGERVTGSGTLTLGDVPVSAVPVALTGTPVVDAPIDALTATPGVLAARPIADRFGTGDSMWPRVVSEVAAVEAPARGPWQSVAGAGAAVGSGMKTTGVATAGFFARAGASIARAF